MRFLHLHNPKRFQAFIYLPLDVLSYLQRFSFPSFSIKLVRGFTVITDLLFCVVNFLSWQGMGMGIERSNCEIIFKYLFKIRLQSTFSRVIIGKMCCGQVGNHASSGIQFIIALIRELLFAAIKICSLKRSYKLILFLISQRR